jgi:stage II sporulation protein AA (anti-sigma F factor antagonist)
MEIQSRMEGRAAVVTVTGRMDAQTASAYQEKMNALMAGGTTAAVVDFDGLDYISSTGLRAVLVTAKALMGKGGQVRFANVKGSVREVFEMSGFSALFPMHESVAAALAGIG